MKAKVNRTRRGRGVGVVAQTRAVDAETLKLATSHKFLAVLRRSSKQLAAGKTLTLDEMKRRVG
jgi:hypothetical protein